MASSWFFQDLMSTIAERGRTLLPNYILGEDVGDGVQKLASALMSGKGEASRVAIAQQLLKHYRLFENEAQQSAFFRYLASKLAPEHAVIVAASEAYAKAPTEENLRALQAAVESPLQEFFRRLNLAPGGTHEIVHMREDLIRLMASQPEHRAAFGVVDENMRHLLQSWFNRGFLVLRRIDWHTPAVILEKIIAYEAVHEIRGWEDLRRRLDPVDRRCFAFFHPSLVDDPLIFVEVALTTEIPDAIGTLLAEPDRADMQPATPSTAVFYSISNCQNGLRGISFGSFLIKQVVEELLREFSVLKTFVTLSPVPRFAGWLAEVQARGDIELGDAEAEKLARLDQPDWIADPEFMGEIRPTLLGLAARYFLTERSSRGGLIDPVARFHLGNGARLERINMAADTSSKGLKEAYGLMVNYLYDPKTIEQNHEAFANTGEIAASRQVRNLLRTAPAAPQVKGSAPQLLPSS